MHSNAVDEINLKSMQKDFKIFRALPLKKLITLQSLSPQSTSKLTLAVFGAEMNVYGRRLRHQSPGTELSTSVSMYFFLLFKSQKKITNFCSSYFFHIGNYSKLGQQKVAKMLLLFISWFLLKREAREASPKFLEVSISFPT